MMNKVLYTIAIPDIDLDDDLYQYSSPVVPEPLRLSIQRFGLLNPIILQRKARSAYRIVCGFKRLAALVSLKAETAQAFVVEESCSQLDLFTLAIQDNQSVRELDPVEVATILAKLQSTFGIKKEDIVTNYLPLLGFGKNARVLTLYSGLHTLSVEWQDALKKDMVSLDFAQDMLKRPPEERQHIKTLVHNLRLGKNRQREFIKLLADVARLEDLSLSQLIASRPVQMIQLAEKLTPSQKAERLKEWLWEKRYPQYTAIKAQYDAIVRAAHLPPNIHIHAPAFFENNEYLASFTFVSKDDFEKSITALSEILNRGLVKKMSELA
ncbi:ParB N-terminal domain-containing protein [candidate division KSB1 bacterium]|nr:ParB N-terminal domain-containing protein [candidate division KSB1 bacterium]